MALSSKLRLSKGHRKQAGRIAFNLHCMRYWVRASARTAKTLALELPRGAVVRDYTVYIDAHGAEFVIDVDLGVFLVLPVGAEILRQEKVRKQRGV